jgi:plasmid stability protein
MAKEIILRTKVDEDTHKRIRVRAAREGLTRQDWIKQAILAFLKREGVPEPSSTQPEVV